MRLGAAAKHPLAILGGIALAGAAALRTVANRDRAMGASEAALRAFLQGLGYEEQGRTADNVVWAAGTSLHSGG